MRKRRYRAMDYVYKRGNGWYQIRYPIPGEVRSYFPKRDGKSFKKHIIVSLGTCDPTEANRLARFKFVEIENKFSVLREGAQSEKFASFCQFVFDQEMELATQRRLDSSLSKEQLDEEHRIHRSSLADRTIDALEAHVGWMVDVYFEHAAGAKAVVPSDTELRNTLLNAAADVMSDVHTQMAASSQGLSYKPKLTAAPLLARSEPVVVVGDNIPMTQEGRLSLEKYWDVHEQTKQSSSSPVKEHTLKRRKDAWTELKELLGADTRLYKVKKSDIWKYRDALTEVPARAGSIIALRDLTFPERIQAMKANPARYKRLDLNSIGDRLRQVSAVFELAVKRGHLTSNPATGVSEGKKDGKRYRNAYSVEELQLIFSSPPLYHQPCPIEQQTDEFWVPLLELFMGARASEVFVQLKEVHEEEKVPYIQLIDEADRSLKNRESARTIPLHPQLIELGFIEYCRNMRRQGDKLFPKWKFRENQKPSDGPARRRFNRRLKQILPDREFPADSHTFRGTFETALSVAEGVPERVSKRLLGRALGGSLASYVDSLPDEALGRAIAKVEFPGLTLNHLYPDRG